MSDIELNVSDIKKILEAHKLYKPGMTMIEMEQVYYSYKCKEAVEAEGLYESGMSEQDIKDIYTTLKKSEESAGNDNEYRELLNRTETNCSDIDMLVEDSNTMNNDETVDVTSIQSVSPKPFSITKSFSSSLKKQVGKPIKNINVLMEVKANHPLLKLHKVNYSNAPVIYYHQAKILKLPLNERAARISQYLLNLQKFHKNENNCKTRWSNPIQPQQKKPFNGDLCVDFIPDPPEEIEKEPIDPFKSIELESPVKDNISTRSKRVVKRKNYTDQIIDDDDDFTINKKCKSNDELNFNNENSPESKWITRKKKAIAKPSLYCASGSDRIEKMFGKLIWDESSNKKTEKKSTAQNLQDTLNLSDSDEDLFSTKELVTTVNIHKEEDQAIKNKYGKVVKAKKASPKKRAAYNKLSVQKNSATKENESPEIPTVNFYGKNKNSEVDESNNNKLENNEELTNCPICNQLFHVSKIEVHASNCTQYEGKNSETYCDICNELIPEKKLQSHRFECLAKITEASIVVHKPVTRSQRTNVNGFLCHICDKYICNTNEIQHASNCIAKV